MTSMVEAIENIELCLLPKLPKDFDEYENDAVYDDQLNRLHQHYRLAIETLGTVDLRKTPNPAPLVSLTLILYKELLLKGPWNVQKTDYYTTSLSDIFEIVYNVKLDEVLTKDSIFNKQKVFDQCFEYLNRSLNTKDYKKYPRLIEVYCVIVSDIKSYPVRVHPVKALPASLQLIEDRSLTLKKKGLQSCKLVLQCLTHKDFEYGNYYAVVYASLRKNLLEKDIEVTQLLLECLLHLLILLPPDLKISKTDELYSNVLDQLQTESNLYRKKAFFTVCKDLIQMIGVESVSKRAFPAIVCDNLDACCIDAVAEILLLHVLECLDVWIKHCWCVWQLSTHYKILSSLLKTLYTCKDEQLMKKLRQVIVILISLCSTEEQKELLNNMQSSSETLNEVFKKNIDVIKEDVKTLM